MGLPWPAGAGAAGLCVDGASGGALGAGPGCRAVSCACNLALVAWAGAWAAAVAMSPSPARGWVLRAGAGAGAGAGAPLQPRPAHLRRRWQERSKLLQSRARCTRHGSNMAPGGSEATHRSFSCMQYPAHEQDCCSGWCVPGDMASGSSCSSAKGTLLGAPLSACGSAESRLLVVSGRAGVGLSSAAGHALQVCWQKQPPTIHCDRHLPKVACMSGKWLICKASRYSASDQSTGLPLALPAARRSR